MPKIKLIKRTLLSELGNEFTVLTDAEAAESGITVAEDEVLVVEAPAPPTTPGGGSGEDEARSLRERLHTVNQESAARRIELKQLKDKLTTIEQEKAQLTNDLTQQRTVAAQATAKELFTKYVTDKKLEFVSAEAASDIQELAFKELDWAKPVTPEQIEATVKPILEKKSYVLKTVTLPPTDGGRQSPPGPNDALLSDDEMATIAREFNIPVTKKE